MNIRLILHTPHYDKLLAQKLEDNLLVQELVCFVTAHIATNNLGGTVALLSLLALPLKRITHTPSSQADEDALLKAARDGNVKEVMRLLDKGVNKECKDLVRPPPFFFKIHFIFNKNKTKLF